jgi:hypothetical protein
MTGLVVRWLCAILIFSFSLPAFANQVKLGLGYDRSRDGHGFDLHKINNTYVLYFYTHDASGNPEWLLGLAEIESGVIEGKFLRFQYDSSQSPSLTQEEDFDGEFRLDFTKGLESSACKDGIARDNALQVSEFFWRVGEESSTWCTEFLAIGNDPASSPYYGGVWYAGESDSGFGFTMNHMDNTVSALVYYYDADGQPRWALGVAPDDAEQIQLNHHDAYCRTCTPKPMEITPAGTLTIQRNSESTPVSGGGDAILDISYPLAPFGDFEKEFVLYNLADGKSVDRYGGFANKIRAVHIGGNWQIPDTFPNPNDEYFEFLRSMNVNWIGFSVALHVSDALDSTVESDYTAAIPSFRDEEIIEFVRRCREEGFNVYMTLAFEIHEAHTSEYPVQRQMLGDPVAAISNDILDPENWPWALDHPDHERFKKEFWDTYTERAVHYARIAKQAGVAMYGLGTETFGLFRTRPGFGWPNTFKEELQTMVRSVRESYSGLLTYAQEFGVILWGPEAWGIWEDLDLDVVGISMYTELVDQTVDSPMSTEDLKPLWREKFNNALVPHKAHNPEKPMVFVEFGFTDSVLAPFDYGHSEQALYEFQDSNSNGVDDGEETQKNIFEAFYDVRNEFPGIVSGTYLWDIGLASEEEWKYWFEPFRNFSIRGKAAEEPIRNAYWNWLE